MLSLDFLKICGRKIEQRCRGIVSPRRASACPGEMIPPVPPLMQGKMRRIGLNIDQNAGLP